MILETNLQLTTLNLILLVRNWKFCKIYNITNNDHQCMGAAFVLVESKVGSNL